MNASRLVLRAQRPIRFGQSRVYLRQYASNSSSPAASGALSGGLIGGGTALAVAYGWYHFSGAKTAVQTAHQAKSYVDEAFNFAKLQLPEKDPSATDAIQTLQDTANKYAAFIPGGKAYVDSAFKDLHAIRKQHGEEVDKLVREAYTELRNVSNKGLSLESAGEAIDVLVNLLSRLSSIAGDAAEDVLDGHPQIKEKLGGSTERLKELSDRYGPEVRKQLKDVQDQTRDIMKSGMSWDAVQKIQSLVQEMQDKAQRLGEEALNNGIDELKPILDKNPKVKELVEENIKALKNANTKEVIDTVRKAISTGNTGPLEEYIKQVNEKK